MSTAPPGLRPVFWHLSQPAVVHGYAARALSIMLRADAAAGRFDPLPAEGRALTMAAIRAIELAGEAWMSTRTADTGSSAVGGSAVVAHWSGDDSDDLPVADAAALLDVGERRMRDLAATGLGRKVGGRWVVSRSAVLAELERRTAA